MLPVCILDLLKLYCILLIMTAGYTEASKIQTTGPIRPKFEFKLSIMFTNRIYENLHL